MTSFHMTLCSAAVFAVLGLAGCQSPEEREAAVERDAFTQLADEVEGHMNKTFALLQTLWDIELEYGTPEGADRTCYRFFPTDPTAHAEARRSLYERTITAYRGVYENDLEADVANMTRELERWRAELGEAIPYWQREIEAAQAAIAADPAGTSGP